MDPTCQLTTFDNVACCTSVVRGAHPAPNPLHVKDTTAVTDIVEYLSRPYEIISGPLNNTTNTFIWAQTLNIASYYALNPNWPKTANVFGLRATVCFKLQILATPQHSGIYRLVFQPMTQERFANNSSLQASYLPHAQLNLSEGTEVTLKVPYIHPNTYMARNDTTFSLGRAVFWALTPTGYAAGDLPPRYRIWSWLEDVDLIASTSTNGQALVSQAGTKVTKTKVAVAAKPVTAKQKLTTTDKEIKAANLSSILAAGSTAASFVGKMIPSLSAYTGTTSWAFNYAANLAYSFGWSKPRDNTPITRMFRSINTGQHNVDGANNAHNLSLISENALSVAPLGGTEVDEMSLAYILTRPGVTSRFSYAAQVSGTDLYTFTVRPNSMFSLESGSHNQPLPTTGSFIPTTQLYYANDFALWKGTIKIRLTAAITKFHAGRLLVGYVPQFNSSLTPATTDALNYMSTIWDLRDNPVLEFDIPFIFPRPYAPVGRSTGVFFVRVLDPLVAPGNVSPIVTILVEHSAGPDFECARPAVATLIPNGVTPALVSQSGVKVLNTDDRSPADLCVGESIRSVKQLISRAYYIGSMGLNTNATLANQNTTQTFNGSILNKWKACYTFWRGSFDYHIIPNTSAITTSVSFPAVTGQFASPLSNIVVTEQTGLHFTLPFYKDVPMVSYTTTTFTPESTARIFTSSDSTATNAKVGIFGHAGEDTQYFYFIGPPSVTANPAAATVLQDDFYLWANRSLPPGPSVLPNTSLPIAPQDISSSEEERFTSNNPPSSYISLARTDTYAYEIDEI